MNLWLLLLHIVSLLVWAAGALYLPLIISAESQGQKPFVILPSKMGSASRVVYCYIATPAAIAAIIAGTLVFVVHETLTFWLLAKMTLVTLLVILHASIGLLITRLERQEMDNLPRYSNIFLILLGTCFLGILLIVLSKTASPGFLPWSL